MTATGRRVREAIVVIHFVNLAAFVIESLALGGNGVSGREVNGRYFVSSHGRYSEIGRTAFIWSRYHGYATLALAIVAVLAGIQLLEELTGFSFWRRR